MSKAIDLTNKRFNMITVIEKTDRRDCKGSVIWKCRCDCGNEIELSADKLMHGDYISCGCHRIEHGRTLKDTLTFVDGTCIEWLNNRTTRADNTSGHSGVNRTKFGRYTATIGMSGRRYYLGTYKTYEEAVSIREAAEKSLHRNFIDAYRKWADQHHNDNSSFSADIVRSGPNDFKLVIPGLT